MAGILSGRSLRAPRLIFSLVKATDRKIKGPKNESQSKANFDDLNFSVVNFSVVNFSVVNFSVVNFSVAAALACSGQRIPQSGSFEVIV